MHALYVTALGTGMRQGEIFARGVHPKVVQERPGHATISITLDTYSHWIPSMGADAAAAIDGLFAAGL